MSGTFAHSQSFIMASLTFTNAYLVDFESVLNIPYNEGMQNMFKSLESSGLRGFLGCKSVLYEPELENFFDTALIQGGDITGVISGKYFSISPSRFAGVFELPTEGLSDFSDVPRNLVSDARKIFSKSGVPVVPHGKKKLLKYEYRLLNDILAKSITVKEGSFDAVTTKRFQMMTTIHFGLKLGGRHSNPVVTTPTIALDFSDTTQQSASHNVAPNQALTTKNQAQTTRIAHPKAHASSRTHAQAYLKSFELQQLRVTTSSAIITSQKAQNAALPLIQTTPLQRSRTSAPADQQQPKQRNRYQQQWIRVTSSLNLALNAISTSSNFNSNQNQQIFIRHADDIAAATKFTSTSYNDFVSRNNEPEIVGTRTFTEAEGSTSPVVEKNLIQAVGSKQFGEEHMSIDDLLMQISEDMMLPSVTAAEITKIRFGGSIHIPVVQERDLYYASLPCISIHEKGRAILEEYEPVRGIPARETVELLCGDVDFSFSCEIRVQRNEQLEFQTKIAADILSLSTQLGDLVEYIRGGDAKKGEGSSSRRPLPTPVHQSEGTGDVVRLTEPTQEDIDVAQRDIFERMARADR
ncbi:hypothetical protein F511_27574 [Dorcoceras hygrometricum]|uniref:Uncharacterized protein n=1 Tax=Dorcoceras hygrometricum TaxID=472368 RepID=A0A2Z7B3P6_9LAMI|nr:hypothetical protein F511_27574 [Dorcoceras hygrometricum]